MPAAQAEKKRSLKKDSASQLQKEGKLPTEEKVQGAYPRTKKRGGEKISMKGKN